MSKTISSRRGRIWLMCLIAACFLGALLSLFFAARGGAISVDNQMNAVVKLIGFYLPILTLIGVFFFKDRQGENSGETPIEAFLFAIFITSIWVLTPILLLWFESFIEDVIASIDKFKPLGETFVLGGIGYYFSKSN